MNTRILSLLSLLFVLSASAERYVIQPGASNVLFHSEATIESFEGTTDQVSGEIEFDPAVLGEEAKAWFEVDLLSLDTGMSLRNSHMRDNHLHTDKYPSTRFDMTEILSGQGPLSPGESRKIQAAGQHALHGVVVARAIDAEVTLHANGSATPAKTDAAVVHVVCMFDVGLEEHKIPRPEFLFMKVAESIQVTVEFWAVQQ